VFITTSLRIGGGGAHAFGGEDNIGDFDTDEEEDGAVTVLKLSNGVMFRVPVEVQDMQTPDSHLQF
jgi:hypothetical protein